MAKNSVIMKLNGGLGNQMFQWALSRMIQETTDMDVSLDMSYFSKHYARDYQLNIFQIKPEFVKNPITKFKLNVIWNLRKMLNEQKLLGYSLYSEKQFNFEPRISEIKANTYIEGFFQSELYFKCIEQKLREDFRFEAPPDEENQKIINKLYSVESIALHIRRGDYIQKERYKNIYANCSLDYYKRAVDYITKHCSEPILLVFSDDIEWVKKNLKLNHPCVFVSHNTGTKSYEDMRLMSLCTHNIIANSSFSWWGAWLNQNPSKIVVAPKKWFNDDEIIQTDVIPKTWIQLEN
ncbi:MAG: alpha-1,2-fucosyltransferase [bacterium]